MAILLGLLVFCLGAYFLHIFFQISRLEKALQEHVSELERFLKLHYGMTEKKVIEPKESSNE